ncbi:MAG: 5'-3' exonuclease H3TH domain-containing protein, partial [Rhodospirillaceae bacterium]
MAKTTEIPEAKNGPRHVYLVDGSGYIFRAFHALPPMTRPDGTPVNAVYGFTSMLLKLREETDADCIIVVFDSARTSFRNEIYADYKAHRPEPPEELVPQFALIREATTALGLPSIEQNGFEADDLIATYARLGAKQGAEVTIVSSDKDLMQLVGGPIAMFDPVKARKIGPDEVREKFGVGPDKVVEVQSLAGDSTDNVPGVPGIGIKTAAELINQYGDLETLLTRASEIKQPKRRENLIANADKARISRELVTLKDDIDVKVTLEAMLLKPADREPLVTFLEKQGFKSLIGRLGGKFERPSPAATAAVPKEAQDKSVYELVQTEAALKLWIDRARNAGVVAFDTETTSLDAMRARLVGFSMSVEPGRACYVPLTHGAPAGQASLDLDQAKPAEAPKQIPLERAMALLRPLLADPGVLKVGHNLKYDMLVLARPPYEAPIAPVDDSMLFSYVVDAGKNAHNMDDLARLHLGVET